METYKTCRIILVCRLFEKLAPLDRIQLVDRIHDRFGRQLAACSECGRKLCVVGKFFDKFRKERYERRILSNDTKLAADQSDITRNVINDLIQSKKDRHLDQELNTGTRLINTVLCIDRVGLVQHFLL